MCVHNHTLHLPVFMFYLNASNAFMGLGMFNCLRQFVTNISNVYENVFIFKVSTQRDHAIACTCSSGHALLVKNPTFLSM